MRRLHEGSAKLILNLPELLALVENDHELLSDLIGLFREEFPLLLKSLKDGAACEDMRKVEVAGHTLKGMLSNLRANRAALAAEKIDPMGREQERNGLQEAISALEAEAAALVSELDDYIAKLKVKPSIAPR